jgi:hypothetical protein
MEPITVYKVGLTGDVTVQAANEVDARNKALAFFALDPNHYMAILEVKQILLDTPAP